MHVLLLLHISSAARFRVLQTLSVVDIDILRGSFRFRHLRYPYVAIVEVTQQVYMCEVHSALVKLFVDYRVYMQCKITFR